MADGEVRFAQYVVRPHPCDECSAPGTVSPVTRGRPIVGITVAAALGACYAVPLLSWDAPRLDGGSAEDLAWNIWLATPLVIGVVAALWACSQFRGRSDENIYIQALKAVLAFCGGWTLAWPLVDEAHDVQLSEVLFSTALFGVFGCLFCRVAIAGVGAVSRRLARLRTEA